jgi:hypothetical protein
MEQQNSASRSQSVREFSKAHGWSVWLTYKLAREGRLRISKVGRRSIITREDEAAFLASLPILNGGSEAA